VRLLAHLLAGLVSALSAACAGAATPVELPEDAVLVLCYHDVVESVHGGRDRDAVSVDSMVAHFAWLRESGFHAVSLEQVLRARAGGPALPAHPVLLTFDDGYASFNTRVMPLLRLYRYPAVLAVVGSWLDAPAGSLVQYGDDRVPREKFLQWSEVRELAQSGLVEIASHTYDLHHGVIANAEGSTQPAAITRLYDAGTGRYEDDAAYTTRLREDIARNSAAIERATGVRPRAMVWPFGAYNRAALDVARSLGMPVTFSLTDGLLRSGDSTAVVPRNLMEKNPSLLDMMWDLRALRQHDGEKIVFLSLDSLYGADAAERERRLSLVVERMARLKPDAVVLRAWHDGGGDGEPDSVYFPSRHLPLRADLFNRVAWQLFTRAGVRIFAALPVASRRLDGAALSGLYADLARQAPFQGLYFEGAGAGDPAVTGPLVEAALAWRAPLRSFAAADPARVAAAGGAPELLRLLDTYDLVALDVRPDTAAADAARTVVQAGGRNGAASRVVFRLRLDAAAAAHAERAAAALRAVERAGGLSVAYGPDDPEADLPRLRSMRPVISTRAFPE